VCVCVRVCVCARARACVCVCVCLCCVSDGRRDHKDGTATCDHPLGHPRTVLHRVHHTTHLLGCLDGAQSSSLMSPSLMSSSSAGPRRVALARFRGVDDAAAATAAMLASIIDGDSKRGGYLEFVWV
jgi:hypothetical protein